MLARQEADRTIFIVNPRTPSTRLALGPYSIGTPTGLGVAGSVADRVLNKLQFGHEVDIKVVDEDLRQRIDPKPGDLVLASAFSLTSKRVKTIIREVNEQGGYVVVGGIHATVNPDDFANTGGISFRGEAGNSVVFSQLMSQYLNTGMLDRGTIFESEALADPRSIDLAGLPVSEKVYEELDKNRLVHSTFATLGCPYKCGFCTVMAGSVVRKRPVEEVIEEIKLRSLDKYGFTLADSNLGAGGKKYLHELLEGLAQLEIPRAWNSEISIDFLYRGGGELLDSLKAAQCHRLFVGFESPDDQNLESVDKDHNLKIDPGQIKEIVEEAHKRGIKITGLFIVGFLTDTVKSIRSIEKFIKDNKLDGANIFIMTPLPGTRIWNEFAADGRFDPETLDTDDLDLRHLVFNHPLGNDVLLRENERLCNRVFAVPTVLSRSTRIFWMSLRNRLPKNFERIVRNSFGTDLLQADLHRGARFIRAANRIYEMKRQLSGAGN